MKNRLAEIGLDTKTETIYRSLLSLGDAPVSRIARDAGVPRTSAYYLLQGLVALGLASTYNARGVRRFVAEHPRKLRDLFERQMIIAERLIPDLEAEIQKNKSGALVRLFEGTDGVRALTEEALKSKSKIVYSIGSSRELLTLLGGKYGFGTRRRKQGIRAKVLRFARDFDSKNTSAEEKRILPDSFSFPGFILVFDFRVAIIPFQKPPVGILIENALTADILRSVFNILWRTSHDPQNKKL